MALQGRSHSWKKLDLGTKDKGCQKRTGASSLRPQNTDGPSRTILGMPAQKGFLITARRTCGESHCTLPGDTGPSPGQRPCFCGTFSTCFLVPAAPSSNAPPPHPSVTALPFMCCSRFHFQYFDTFPLFPEKSVLSVTSPDNC